MASFSNSSSGIDDQRKNDNRDASSVSLMRYAVFGATPAGGGSKRKMNSGSARIRRSAISMPASKLPVLLRSS
jgi:hypothetical protein